MSSPTETLAGRIVRRLVAHGLLSDEAAKKLAGPLAAGTLSQEDWRFAFELTKAEQR